jgi:hypothetical protein
MAQLARQWARFQAPSASVRCQSGKPGAEAGAAAAGHAARQIHRDAVGMAGGEILQQAKRRIVQRAGQAAAEQ